MEKITIKDKQFSVFLSAEDIQKQVRRVASEINRDLAGKRPLFMSVLNGSFMFTADLMKHITIPCEISFVKLASYQGVMSTGKIKEVIGINEDLTDRVVVIVEDIVDTGLTMQRLLESLGTRNPREIHIATLLLKPDKLKVALGVEYVAFSIPNDFIVGYGLDYDGLGRNLPCIYSVAPPRKKPEPAPKLRQKLNIVIFGAPGTGKGTQSDRIVEHYGNMGHISTGDVLRKEIRTGSELGQTAKHYIDKGQLIPDELMISILGEELDRLQTADGVVFDGFPRTIAQAEALRQLLNRRGQKVSIMLDLEVPEDELMRRLLNRGKLSGRSDDNEATIRQRLSVYHSQTAPLIGWYKGEGVYTHINGVGDMDEITRCICQAIDEKTVNSEQ